MKAVQIYEVAKPVKGFGLLLGNKHFEKREILLRFFKKKKGVVIFNISPIISNL
jgi:hypothetical protein